jgi:Ran GTPase-activating protein (RanGAP) involved in mRNA processing and transport
MTFISSRLVQEDIITELAKKSVIRVGCSSFADDENKNFEILTAVLRTTATLETLQLDDTAAALQNDEFLTALAQNRTIRFLNLRCSGCDDGGATALAAVLKENSTLQTISLNDDNICDVGAKALAEALKENGSVQKIYLNDNNISDEGAIALADALRGNDGSLQLISLRRNKLTNEGAETFADVLEEKKTSQKMHVMDWGVAKEGRETELTEKTPKTSSPVSKVESLASNQISDEGERATADTNILDRHQIEMDKLLAERKLMMQQLDNLSTARHEAQDELAAKDAMLKMKDEKLLTLRKQLDDYQRAVDKVTAEQQRMRQQLEDKLFADNALAAAKDGELKIKSEEILNLRKQLDQKEAAKVLAETKVAEINAELNRNDDLIKMKDAELSHLRNLQNQLSIQRNELEARIIMGQQQMKQLLDNLSADIARVKASEASKDADLRMIQWPRVSDLTENT